MWKWTGTEKGLEPVSGVPAQDMSDEEFREAERWYEGCWPEGTIKGHPLRTSGLYVHEEDPPKESRRATEAAT